MKARIKKYKDVSSADFLVLREKLGLKTYRKMAKRDREERRILFNLALRRMEEKEKDDFLLLGYRRRRLKTVF